MPRYAINGLGRIGKLVFRQMVDLGLADQIVLVNHRSGNPEIHAHMLEFDSVHGRWQTPIGYDDKHLLVAGQKIPCIAESTFEAQPLAELGVDILIECTGAFKTPEKLQPCFDAGVKKVVVSQPVKKEPALNLVYGVNDDLYDPAEHHLITAASCTTNCLAPVVKVLHEAIGIRHGSITTVHDVTNSQTIIDKPHKDLRRARSALMSLVPTTTGSASAITMIYPELKGRLNGHAIRVPLLNASLTDCVFEMERETTVEEVNGLFAKAAEGDLKGILGYETRPLVSQDFLNDSRSAIIDAPSTMVVNGTQVKVYAWYDNEWGYACRLVDVSRMVADRMSEVSAREPATV